MTTIKIFATLMFAIYATSSTAQTITGRFEFGYADYALYSIPKEFAHEGATYLLMYDGNDRNTILIYDEKLEETKRIALKEEIPFNYQLTYQDMVRDVVAVNEVNKYKFQEYESYEKFIETEKMKDPGFDESWLTTNDMGNGTKKIIIDYSRSGYITNYDAYFAYNQLGMQYPKIYFIDNGKTVTGYRAAYEAQYSEWRTTGTRVVNCSENQKRIRLCNINLNHDDGKANGYFEVSQTLFNDDVSFEYIMPKYKLSTNGNVGKNQFVTGDGNNEEIVTTDSIVISEQKELALAGFQILSENGNVVSDITFDSGFEGIISLDRAFVISIGSTVYLAFDGYCNNRSSTIFYKIDNKSTNAIKKVKISPSTMNIHPTVVNGGSTINVTFGDTNEKGSDIVVASAMGTAVRSYHVPAGQTSVQIQTNTSAGIYCVSRLQKNKIAETKKIIIK